MYVCDLGHNIPEQLSNSGPVNRPWPLVFKCGCTAWQSEDFLDPADGASVNFKYTVHFAYFADKVWSHVWSVAELSKHLQVADTANGIPEVNQAVGAHQQQSHVGPDEIKLGKEM